VVKYSILLKNIQLFQESWKAPYIGEGGESLSNNTKPADVYIKRQTMLLDTRSKVLTQMNICCIYIYIYIYDEGLKI